MGDKPRGGVNLLGGRGLTRELSAFSCRKLGKLCDIDISMEWGFLPLVQFDREHAAGLLFEPVDRLWLGGALETVILHEMKVYNHTGNLNRLIYFYRSAGGRWPGGGPSSLRISFEAWKTILVLLNVNRYD